mgnify:CR=1 FL=1
MKYKILLDILFELLSKRRLTANYLAEKHGISPRTVYRYIEILSLAVPVQVQAGRNGGIFISDAYKLPVNFMTKAEYEAAIEALSAMYSQLPEPRFLAAKRKLSAQAKSEIRDLTLSGSVGTILVDSGTWGDTRNFSEKIRLVEGCIRDCAVLEIEYTSRTGEESRRKIEPHVLVFKQGVWYVYAFCRKQRAFRLFRLGRIKSALLSGEKFIRRPFRREDIPLNYWTDETSSVDVRLEVSEEVTLEIEREAFADVQDWLGVESLREKDGKWYADVRLPDDSVLIRKIVSFGDAVKGLFPESVRQKVRETAEKIALLYR